MKKGHAVHKKRGGASSGTGSASALSATDVAIVRVPKSTQARRTFKLRAIDQLGTSALSGAQLQFASTSSPVVTFLQMAQGSPSWGSIVSSGYDEYRILSVRLSYQPVNRYVSVTRSTGTLAIALDADSSSPAAASIRDVFSYTSSRFLPSDEHWEVVWVVPQAADGIWYDIAGVTSTQIGCLVCYGDTNFSASTLYGTIALEVECAARGQFG